MDSKNVLSAAAGGIFFAVPYLALSVPILPSLLIGGGAFVAGQLVFGKNDSKLRKFSYSLYEQVENAKKLNKHILDMNKKIDSPEVKRYIVSINDTIYKIISAIEADPKKHKKVKNFFEYYLPTTVSIIDRYDVIEDLKLTSSDSEKFMQSTDKMIKNLDAAYKKMLNNIYESEILETGVDLKVFDAMMQSDGIKVNNAEEKESK